MIRIAVDAQIADVSRAGIGQFTSDLLIALGRRADDCLVIPIRPHRRVKDFSMLERIWWDQIVLPWRAWRNRADIILKTGFSTPLFSMVPTITIVHDLAARRFPEQLHRPSAWFYGRFVPFTYRRARKLIAISQSTAREIHELIGTPENNIVTIMPGGDMLAQPGSDNDLDVLSRFQLPDRYVLHIGTIEPRKNLAFLVRAFAVFLRQHPAYQLVLAGNDGWLSEDVHTTVRELHLTDQVKFLGSVTDPEKRALLRCARILAFPSLYEGFGLPVLEAMRSGTPVVASRTTSIPEVLGDAGLLIDGYDESVWADALSRAAEDQGLRQRLASLGLDRAALFSWDQAATAIIDLVKSYTHEHHR